MKILKVYSALVLSLAFVFTPALTPLRAQAPAGKSAGGFGGGDRFLNGRGPAIERLMSELTDDQKASLREAMVAQRERRMVWKRNCARRAAPFLMRASRRISTKRKLQAGPGGSKAGSGTHHWANESIFTDAPAALRGTD